MIEKEMNVFEVVGASGMVHRVKGTHCVIDEVVAIARATIYKHTEVVGSYIDYKSLTTLSPDVNTDSVDFDEYKINHSQFTRAIEESYLSKSKIAVLTNLNLHDLSQLKLSDVLKVEYKPNSEHFTLYVPRK